MKARFQRLLRHVWRFGKPYHVLCQDELPERSETVWHQTGRQTRSRTYIGKKWSWEINSFRNFDPAGYRERRRASASRPSRRFGREGLKRGARKKKG